MALKEIYIILVFLGLFWFCYVLLTHDNLVDNDMRMKIRKSFSDVNLARSKHLKYLQKQMKSLLKEGNNATSSRKLSVNQNYYKLRNQTKIFEDFDDSSIGADERLAGYQGLCRLEKRSNACVIMNEIEHRERHVKKVCQFLDEDKLRPFEDTRKLFVLKERKLVWCPVLKAASSNIMEQLPFLTSHGHYHVTSLRKKFKRLKQGHEIARMFVPNVPLTKFRKFLHTEKPLKLLVVRHPFDRLISAFRDKFSESNTYYKNLYGKIITKEDRQPTFKEFVRSFIYHGLKDGHWEPIYSTCSLCRVEYDVILKVENLRKEMRFLIKALGLQRIMNSTLTLNKNTWQLTQQEQKSKYFDTLSDQEKMETFAFYRYDFELFEYSTEPYMSTSCC